jgi:uncharacterized integral membrane protein (TIGR00698 family)
MISFVSTKVKSVQIKSNLNGILFTAAITAIVLIVAPYISFLNAIIIGFIVGLIVGNLFNMPTSFKSGIKFTSSKFLELSILFLAFGVNYTNIAELGWQRFIIILIVVASVLLVTLYLSKKLKCPSSVGWLVGFGTAICGSSAIAALAPSVKKNPEDVGVAMAVVNLFGSLGMIMIPLVVIPLGLEKFDVSMLIGGSLHSVGNVAGAGYGMDQEIGNMAVTVKLARVALLSPALIFFNLMLNTNKSKHWTGHLKLPWYLWGFILITVLVSMVNVPAEIINWLEFIGKIILTVAMVAIGLSVSFKDLIKSGKKGLLFGAIIFAIHLIILSTFIFIF